MNLQHVWNAPLPLVLKIAQDHSFGAWLSPVYFSVQPFSASELLRTL